MKVRALAKGFYDRLYEPGQVFEIVDDQHLGSWMEPVEEADRKANAAKLAVFAQAKRASPPGVPPTTGPGIVGGLTKPIAPQPNPKPAPPKS